MTRMRLDAYLSRGGMGTRSEVKRLIKKGMVGVDGTVCKNIKQIIDQEKITVDGDAITLPPSQIDCILYKPCGYACSHDPFENPIIYELLPDSWMGSGIQSAGRLDRATSGLLVMTTNGQRIHSLIHPKKKIPKRYRITYSGSLHKQSVEKCAEGLQLESDIDLCLPAELDIHDDQHATMVLYEGRYHQVRKMIAALGGTVVELHRDKIGNFELPQDLQEGMLMEIDEKHWRDILSPKDDKGK
ncbi:MAG: rRNA pseudouridine synthase [Planctomycetes bacterium]|nr:rRNA pseudouridine synthase [Planctomycetota bacterium]